jgi:hypothetical protein
MGIDDLTLGHLANWFECMRSHQQPHCTVREGFAHSVACMMATELTGREGSNVGIRPLRRSPTGHRRREAANASSRQIPPRLLDQGSGGRIWISRLVELY